MPAFEEIAPIIGELVHEPSDRGAAVLGASLLDGALEAALLTKCRKLTESEQKDMFGPDAPLGSFSAKIRAGYALRLFGPLTRTELDAIREVRNAFAHTRRRIYFTTPEVAAVCKRIKLPDRIATTVRSPESDRANYTLACIYFIMWFDDVGRRRKLRDRAPWTAIMAE